jgi:hypothetical protein
MMFLIVLSIPEDNIVTINIVKIHTIITIIIVTFLILSAWPVIVDFGTKAQRAAPVSLSFEYRNTSIIAITSLPIILL